MSESPHTPPLPTLAAGPRGPRHWLPCLFLAFLFTGWCCAGGGVYVEMFRLRHFADHAGIRDAGRALLAQHEAQFQRGDTRFVAIEQGERPPALAALGRGAFVSIRRDVGEPCEHVDIDLGYYFGLSVWPEGAAETGELLVPGLTLWGHP